MKKIAILACLMQVAIYGQAQEGKSYWSQTEEQKIQVTGTREIIPNKYGTFHLVQNNLQSALFAAPHEKEVALNASPLIIALPMPDGTFQHFRVVESPVMEPGLAGRYPQLKTFNVRGVEDVYAFGKLDWTEFGFHGMLRSPNGDVFIDPYCRNNQEDYISYYVSDFEKPASQRLPEVEVLGAADEAGVAHKTAAVPICAGTQLRTYRLAVACTGEYAVAATGQSAPTMAQTLSKVVTTVNRVDGVYETEVAVKLVLVANDTLALFTDASTDPFNGNNNASTLISESQTVIDTYIGNGNYDIGHTFSTGGGGLAQLGCVCSSSSKARGITGSPSPVGDAYDIDYVAHEMGHQFGGNHTFNSTTGSCSGNRNASTSMEPGSGVTIMAYAGICTSTNDLASHSIAYFHGVSFDEIMSFSTGGGNSCAVVSVTGNTPPVVVGTINGSYTIPIGTPFQLTGSATDADGDALTYSWEEMDAGTSSGNWNSGSKPFFRSYAPTTSPTRMFPLLSVVLTGTTTTTKGEFLPTTTQSLKFRLTARDNQLGGGGVCYTTNPTTININQSAGPFSVTYPNTTGISWMSGSTQTITWNVNGTDASPISCANVNILISTNGGASFTTLLANTPNDGTQTITVPTVTTNMSGCRIRIECANNIFFDINDKNFTITVNTTGINDLSSSNSMGLQLVPNPFSGEVTLNASGLFETEKLDVHVYDLLGHLVMEDAVMGHDTFTKSYDLSTLSNGVYIVRVFNGQHSAVARLVKQ